MVIPSDAERFAQTVAAQVRAEIAAANTTVAGVARATGINRETLDRWVKGERALSITTLYRIASAVDVPPHVIVQRAEERFAAQSGSDVGRGAHYEVTPDGPASDLGLAAEHGERKTDS
ncbi:helix-turn-helix domain-containing protein [Homoserinibacter sp. GY 40078]|uniref:helix-turn-helix domain-containing protein n=1 Tax=Homoserinibacter sp. GY 40078 TaxID=2603275 RepID=UPI0011CADD00|nr:helix-turn-helix transcriptional regulator [Homoserinibacter sp. GY 40078]TXK17187.1 helix-turn-helix transcriptional regulator [Homoserinibacter sp. GY 40078]